MKKYLVVLSFFCSCNLSDVGDVKLSSDGSTSDIGTDTVSIKDSAADVRKDLEKGCSPLSCGQGEVCDSVKNICVSCTDDTHCENEVCDDGVCVECVNHSDCLDVDKARCSDGVCKPCDGSIQCGHFQGNLSCGNAGMCECNSDSDCDGGVCDRRPDSAGSCDYTTTPKSQNQCEECISDSECKDGSLCVLTTFKDNDYKYFCLTITAGACPRPYTTSGGNVTSLEGIQMEVCQPIQSRATCDAVVANLKGDTCTIEADCPRSGLCENGKCTYACKGASRECDVQCSVSNALDTGFCR